jgi:hypothetical protein
VESFAIDGQLWRSSARTLKEWIEVDTSTSVQLSQKVYEIKVAASQQAGDHDQANHDGKDYQIGDRFPPHMGILFLFRVHEISSF